MAKCATRINVLGHADTTEAICPHPRPCDPADGCTMLDEHSYSKGRALVKSDSHGYK